MRNNCAVSVVMYFLPILFGWISSWSHIATTALPRAYALFRFTQHRYVLESIDIAEGQTLNLKASHQLACCLFCNFFYIPLIWYTCISFANNTLLWHMTEGEDPCQHTHKCPSSAVVDLKQPFSFYICPSRLHTCMDSLAPSKRTVHIVGFFPEQH